MVDIAKLAIEVDSSQAVKAADNLDDLSRSSAKTETASKKTGDGLAGMGRKAGAAGIQIQQLVGQVQGGVNPMVALSQQAADLGIVLGAPLIGAVVGITAAIAGPFIASLINASDEADKFNDKIEEIIEGLESTRQETLKGTFSAIQTQLEELDKRQAELNAKDISRIRGVTGQQSARAAREKELAEIQARRIKLTEAQAKVEEELNEETIKNAESVDRFITSLQAQAGAAGLVGAELIKYQKRQDLARLADMGATDEKLTLVSGYYDQLIAVERNRQANTDYAKSMREAQAAQMAFYQALSTDVVFTMSPEQQAAQQLGEQMQKYEELRQNDKISHEQYLAGKEAAEAAYAKRVSDINAQQAASERQQQMDRIGYAADFFGNMASLAQAGGKESFESYKLFASAQAAVNAALAITNVLANVPAPLNFALAGTMAALTAVQIAQIQGAEYQSYEGGGFTGTGPRTGGVDGKGGMMAIVHPNETIIDHTKPGSGQVSSGTTVNVIEDASRAGTQEMSRGPSNEEILNVFVDSIRKGGKAYKAVQGMRGGR